MRIGIYIKDNQPLVGGEYTFINTIKRGIVLQNNSFEIVIIYDFPYKSKEEFLEGFKIVTIFSKKVFYTIFRIKRRLCRMLNMPYSNQKRLKKLFLQENIVLLWIPGPYEIDSPVSYVFTVWDLGHRTMPCFPEVSSNGCWEIREALYKKMLFKASYIITGNKNGKKEILQNYSLNPDKIRIIPFSIPEFCLNSGWDNIKSSFDIKSPFIFYPAQFWAHKNHISLVEAVRYLHAHGQFIHCYFCGSDQGNLPYIKNKINEFHLTNYIHILGFVDTSLIKYLYQNALCLTFVSLLGPNNLPPIEAVSLGCPVIISNIAGHLEQMEDAALPVDATDPMQIATAVIRLLTDNDLRDNLIRKGRSLAEKWRTYSYCDQIKTILDDFQKQRRLWQ
jgi:glycosyltransferase involved in cell wall biosynthesis